MKVLALGATGAIGSQLVTLLASRGEEVAVTSRLARQPHGTIRYIQGNAQDDDFLRDLLRQGWDAIVDFMIYDTEGFRRRVDALLGGCEQYMFTSTGRVFADSATPLTENSARLLETSKDAAFLATEEYALTKARQEDILRTSGKANWTIIRPYITFGEGRLQLGTLEKEAWLFRALRGRSIVFCREMTDKWTTLTDGSDVAGMMAALVGNRSVLGEDFNLTSGKAVTWGNVLSLYAEEIEARLGRAPKILLQDVESFCRWATSVPQIIYDRLYDRRFDRAKIGRIADVAMIDPMAALRRRLQAQLDGGTFQPISSRGEALQDRAAREFTPPGTFTDTRSNLAYVYYRFVRQNIIG